MPGHRSCRQYLSTAVFLDVSAPGQREHHVGETLQLGSVLEQGG
jgi:hypothetical protein